MHFAGYAIGSSHAGRYNGGKLEWHEDKQFAGIKLDLVLDFDSAWTGGIC